jgi:hypothetical protein
VSSREVERTVDLWLDGTDYFRANFSRVFHMTSNDGIFAALVESRVIDDMGPQGTAAIAWGHIASREHRIAVWMEQHTSKMLAEKTDSEITAKVNKFLDEAAQP